MELTSLEWNWFLLWMELNQDFSVKQTESIYIRHMQHPKFLVLDVTYQNRLSHAHTRQQKLCYKVRNPHGT